MRLTQTFIDALVVIYLFIVVVDIAIDAGGVFIVGVDCQCF